MTKPGSDPAREIVAEAPGGQIVAYAGYWLDHRNAVGHIEPVGADPDFRRLGLARAVVAEALTRMHHEGMRTATLPHNADNDGGRCLAESLGFVQIDQTHAYRRPPTHGGAGQPAVGAATVAQAKRRVPAIGPRCPAGVRCSRQPSIGRRGVTMPKSKRQRQQDRTKRQNTTVQRQRAAQRRRAVDAAIAEAHRQHAVMRDPNSSPVDVAEVILSLFEGRPVMPGMALMLERYRGSVAEVEKVAEAVSVAAAARPDVNQLPVLTLVALTAGLTGDRGRARTAIDQALDLAADDAGLRLTLVRHLLQLDMVADGIDILTPLITDSEFDDIAADAQQLALAAAQRRQHEPAPDQCYCGTGRPWPDCCQPREAAALAAFADQSTMDDLRIAMAELVPTSPYAGPVGERIDEWLEEAAANRWPAADQPLLRRLADQHAWVVAALDNTRDDITDNVITAVANDPATPPAIVDAALAWRDHVRYGFWQVADPAERPGLSCIDILTGQRLYVSVSPDEYADLPRWSVLVGAIVPLGGAWRSAGALVRMTPSEANALYDVVESGVEAVVDSLSGRRRRAQRPRPAFGHAPPYDVYAELDENRSPATADLLSKVAGVALASMLADVIAARTTPPMLTNTDGDPMVMIKAKVRVRRGADVVSALTAHPDFDQHPQERGGLTWLGLAMPPEQAAAMLAEARAQLRAQGGDEDSIVDTGEPQRWVRGTIERRGDILLVEVNSEQRLERLLALLDEFDAKPAVVDRSRVDPRQDLAWSPGPRPARGGLAAAAEGWEHAWIDELVPALGDRTPRDVAGSPDWPLVEGLLRQLEYDADVLAAAGERGADTNWLREQLDLPVDRDD